MSGYIPFNIPSSFFVFTRIYFFSFYKDIFFLFYKGQCVFNRTMPRLVLVYRVGKVMYNECGHKETLRKGSLEKGSLEGNKKRS